MPSVSRLGDTCTGHGCFPPRPNDTGNPVNVYVNGILAHRQGGHWVVHSCDDSSHDGTLSGASTTVFVGGMGIARIGDSISCGSAVAVGSSDVFAG